MTYDGVRELIDRLAREAKNYRDQVWHPEYEGQICNDQLDVDMVYSGDITAEIAADTEDATTALVGSIDDEDDASLICDLVNHLPDIIGYIRYLERRANAATGGEDGGNA